MTTFKEWDRVKAFYVDEPWVSRDKWAKWTIAKIENDYWEEILVVDVDAPSWLEDAWVFKTVESFDKVEILKEE